MKGQDQEGDTPAGMPGGKAAMRQQMFEMARQPASEDELESVAFQALPGADSGEAVAAGQEESQADAGLAPPRKSRRGLRKVHRRKSPPEE